MALLPSRLAMLLLLANVLLAQTQPEPPADPGPGLNQAPPRSDQSLGPEQSSLESSSRDTRIDISPPKDDAKNHPDSAASVAESEGTTSDVSEFHPWDPHKATQDDEVGDFYYKRRNYRAALARYQDALLWKNNDALANFRMAQCFEKLEDPDEAVAHYQQYLKILPHGPQSREAQKALARLQAKASAAAAPGEHAP